MTAGPQVCPRAQESAATGAGLGVGVTADLQMLRKFSESKERAVKIEKIRKQGAFRVLTI